MTVAELLREEGKVEGREATQLDIAAKLLKEGAEPRFVAKITELDLAKVEQLKQQVKD